VLALTSSRAAAIVRSSSPTATAGTGGITGHCAARGGRRTHPRALIATEFFATAPVFAALAEAEPGTFYLTDFLLRHFERLVIRGLGLDRHPELFATYFGNYRKLQYLAQAAGRAGAGAGARDRGAHGDWN